MSEGRKDDSGKLRWYLLDFKVLEELVGVLTWGGNKYGDFNWHLVPDAKNRYFSALHRHLAAWWTGTEKDEETGRHHLAHAMCCIMFLLALEWKNARENK